ncbi:MAG: NAD(P)H-dependent oxidoreductase [Fibrobacterota bacterium]|nr:NAD(P)H-dependent oxidoreductase [Fibrobacterota bacterium]QQS05686.1 MAG: NAD(P)H-dependent oxidoreductase [Fibrobacterota bacterium]
MSQTESNLLETLSWRYATKQFDATRKIPEATWETLRKAASLSPSSFGLEPYRLVDVRDPAKRAALRLAAWNQSQVTDASHFVVFAIEVPFGESQIDAFLGRTVAQRGVALESLSAYRGMMMGTLVDGPRAEKIRTWAAEQAYIVLGNLMAAAAQLGVDSCPMEGLDPAKFDEILGLKERGLATVCALPLGYRSTSDKYATLPKVRKPLAELFLEI